jgi:hypothetical protein
MKSWLLQVEEGVKEEAEILSHSPMSIPFLLQYNHLNPYQGEYNLNKS